MKRFAYAAAAIVLTGILVVLAMAVAQRDARIGDASAIENELPYANQPAQPISSGDGLGRRYTLDEEWPPPPIIRGNDSPPLGTFPQGTGPEFRPSNGESLASFNEPQAAPNNIRNPSNGGKLAEPPPLVTVSGINAFNSLLTPSSGDSDSGLRNTPTRMPNPMPELPGNQPIEAIGSSPSSFGLPLTPTLTYNHSSTDTDVPISRLPISNPNPIPSEQPPLATFGSPMIPTGPKYEPQPKYEPAPAAPAPEPFQAPQNQVGFVSAAPGVRQLDGAQNPSLEIRKRAPNEVQVGIPATFSVLVRNVGNATAFDVNVVDAVPKGAKLIRTSPQAKQDGTSLSWKLGELQAGAEQTITIELEPMSEGEIGSVASVNFAAQASVRTMSTQPKLVVKQLLESVVLGGDSMKIMIEVSNVGTGTARNVRLEEDVPQNMRHTSGAKVLELSIGDLAPGESHKCDIELTAVSAGKVSNVLRAVGENASANESSASIDVISPRLQIGFEGPKLRYLERQATYTASITNTGTAIATEVYMTVFLPMGLQFNSAENEGVYIPEQHAVKWLLTELAAGKTAATKLTLLPVEEGDFVLRMQANAESVRAESIEKAVRVDGQSELAFSIEDDNDPIETDGKTTYIVKIVNIGTRVDNEVQLAIDLPDGASVEQVDAPVNYQVSPRAIQFSPILQMKSKDQQTIRVAVRHSREGTHVLRATLKSKLRPGAVIKEESTQVYRDQ